LFICRIRAPNVSAVTDEQPADHDLRAIPSLSPAASAVDHGLPDGNAPQAKPVPGLTCRP
jgi:hypothetical protein